MPKGKIKPLVGPTRKQQKKLDEYNKRIKDLQGQIKPIYGEITAIENARREDRYKFDFVVIHSPDTKYQELKQKHAGLLEDLRLVCIERDTYKKMTDGWNY